MALRAHQAKNSKTVQGLGRAGMVCYGLVHLIVAYLALRVAFGEGGQEADQRGALAEVGSTGVGAAVLWLLAVGLLAYGAWQLMMAAIGFRWEHKSGKRTRKRIGAGVRAVIGFTLSVLAIRIARGNGTGGSGDQQNQELTARLLALPAGQLLVAVVAAVVFGVGVACVVKGVRRSFMDDLDTPDLPSGTRQWVQRLGVAGYLAKGLVLGIVGVLIGFAALNANPGEAGGLDAALRTVGAQPFGMVALVVVALGLAAFGVYCFAAARAHKT